MIDVAALLSLARIHAEQKAYAEASDSLRLSLNLAEELNDIPAVIYSLVNQARALFLSGADESGEAEQVARRAIQLCSSPGPFPDDLVIPSMAVLQVLCIVWACMVLIVDSEKSIQIIAANSRQHIKE